MEGGRTQGFEQLDEMLELDRHGLSLCSAKETRHGYHTGRRHDQLSRVLVITRTFGAPRALVWRAFADPVHLRRGGPEVLHQHRLRARFLRVGGHWHDVMRGPTARNTPPTSRSLV